MTRAAVLALVLLLSLAGTGVTAQASPTTGQSGATPIRGATQTNEGGQVAVSVTWDGPASGLVFRVAMNGHAVNLDTYNLGDLAVLRTGQGRELRPTSWDAPNGGHHREGTLVFPGRGPDGKDVLNPDVHELTLIVRDVADVPERTFRWTW